MFRRFFGAMVGDDLCIVLVAGQFVELLFDAINEGSFLVLKT